MRRNRKIQAVNIPGHTSDAISPLVGTPVNSSLAQRTGDSTARSGEQASRIGCSKVLNSPYYPNNGEVRYALDNSQYHFNLTLRNEGGRPQGSTLPSATSDDDRRAAHAPRHLGTTPDYIRPALPKAPPRKTHPSDTSVKKVVLLCGGPDARPTSITNLLHMAGISCRNCDIANGPTGDLRDGIIFDQIERNVEQGEYQACGACPE